MLSMFAVALLLSLTAATPTPEECAHLNETISAEELHMIFGKWIMHEIYILTGHDDFGQAVRKTNSSQTEFISSEDNQTVLMKQAKMKDEGCMHYSVNFTVAGNSIQVMSTTHNATTKAYFLKTCDDCLMMHYDTTKEDGKSGTFLLFYKKTETLPEADQEKARAQAKCLGFLEPPQFIYKQTELCPELNDTKAKEPEQ